MKRYHTLSWAAVVTNEQATKMLTTETFWCKPIQSLMVNPESQVQLNRSCDVPLTLSKSGGRIIAYGQIGCYVGNVNKLQFIKQQLSDNFTYFSYLHITATEGGSSVVYNKDSKTTMGGYMRAHLATINKPYSNGHLLLVNKMVFDFINELD